MVWGETTTRSKTAMRRTSTRRLVSSFLVPFIHSTYTIPTILFGMYVQAQSPLDLFWYRIVDPATNKNATGENGMRQFGSRKLFSWFQCFAKQQTPVPERANKDGQSKFWNDNSWKFTGQIWFDDNSTKRGLSIYEDYGKRRCYVRHKGGTSAGLMMMNNCCALFQS